MDDFKTIFKKMKIEFGQEYYNDMVSISNRIFSEDMDNLENAIQQNDILPIRKIAHKLYGSFISLYFKKGAEIARKTEISATKNEIERTLQYSNELLSYLKKYQQTIP